MAWLIARVWHVVAGALAGALAYLVFSRTLPDISNGKTLALSIIVLLFVTIGLAVIGGPARKSSS